MTFCTSAAVVLKAGADVSPDLDTEYDQYLIPEAEAYINDYCNFNFITDYATYNSEASFLLQKVCSEVAAVSAINYDTGGYESRMVALDMINVLNNSIAEGLRILKDKEIQEFIKKA